MTLIETYVTAYLARVKGIRLELNPSCAVRMGSGNVGVEGTKYKFKRAVGHKIKTNFMFVVLPKVHRNAIPEK